MRACTSHSLSRYKRRRHMPTSTPAPSPTQSAHLHQSARRIAHRCWAQDGTLPACPCAAHMFTNAHDTAMTREPMLTDLGPRRAGAWALFQQCVHRASTGFKIMGVCSPLPTTRLSTGVHPTAHLVSGANYTRVVPPTPFTAHPHAAAPPHTPPQRCGCRHTPTRRRNEHATIGPGQWVHEDGGYMLHDRHTPHDARSPRGQARAPTYLRLLQRPDMH